MSFGDYKDHHARAEHVAWAKERALGELDREDVSAAKAIVSALASMTSDLNKHPDTRDHVGNTVAMGLIPADTQIVVSHCPPWLMLDRTGPQPHGRSIGSVPLRRHIEKHQPKAVISGHVHESSGHLRYGATDVYNVAERFRLIEVSTDRP